jgi:hypothetical protein
MRYFQIFAISVLLTGCGSQSAPPSAAPARQAPLPKPADETRRFPLADQVDTRVVNDHLLEKPFMPGGTIAHYKKGKTEYNMFVAQVPAGQDTSALLLDWKTALSNAEFVASFGGYFGEDAGKPTFVFSKGNWIAGVVGLPQKEADLVARGLAARIY